MDTQPWLGLRSRSPSANVWPLASLSLLLSHCSVFISRRKPANKIILLASRRAWDSHIAWSQRRVVIDQQPATFTAIQQQLGAHWRKGSNAHFRIVRFSVVWQLCKAQTKIVHQLLLIMRLTISFLLFYPFICITDNSESDRSYQIFS